MKMSVKQRKRQIETRIKLNSNKYIVHQLKLNLTCFYSIYFFWWYLLQDYLAIVMQIKLHFPKCYKIPKTPVGQLSADS